MILLHENKLWYTIFETGINEGKTSYFTSTAIPQCQCKMDKNPLHFNMLLLYTQPQAFQEGFLLWLPSKEVSQHLNRILKNIHNMII